MYCIIVLFCPPSDMFSSRSVTPEVTQTDYISYPGGVKNVLVNVSASNNGVSLE